VRSLKELSVTQAAVLIDRLQTNDYRRPFERGEPERVRARNVIRNASERQRNYISHLFEQLGWDTEKSAGWLQKRHGIRDLATGVFTSRTASEAVYQLEEALKKASKAGRTQRAFDSRLNDN